MTALVSRGSLSVSMVVFIAVVSLWAHGCASTRKRGPTARVGSIEVSLDESRFGPERVAEFSELEGERRVRGSIGAALRRVDLQQPDGSLSLSVVVVSFRFRSAKASQWAGLMAGVDKFGVDVTVRRGDEILATFRARRDDASSSTAGVSSRLSKLLLRVSDEVAEKMTRLDIRDPASREELASSPPSA